MNRLYVGLRGPSGEYPASLANRDRFTGLNTHLMRLIPGIPCCIDRKIATPKKGVLAPARALQDGICNIGASSPVTVVERGRDFGYFEQDPSNFWELGGLMTQCFYKDVAAKMFSNNPVYPSLSKVPEVSPRLIRQRGISAWLGLVTGDSFKLGVYFRLNRYLISDSDYLVALAVLNEIKVMNAVTAKDLPAGQVISIASPNEKNL